MYSEPLRGLEAVQIVDGVRMVIAEACWDDGPGLDGSTGRLVGMDCWISLLPGGWP